LKQKNYRQPQAGRPWAENKKMKFFETSGKRQANEAGFTLIELLVVISIIGLLASIMLVSLNGARAKARDVKRLADKRQVITALNLFYNDNNRWPVSASSGANWNCLAPSSETCWRGSYSGLDSVVTDLKPYMTQLPLINADSGTYANNRLLYISSVTISGQAGAFLIWEKEATMTQAECPSAYPIAQYDKYWYCYEYIGP
jgi:prepilin-type N-terminal cleavage/methylation domain-containing protein